MADHLFDTKPDNKTLPQARMALRILDYESVGKEKKSMKIPKFHPDHAEQVLSDPTDPNGPKL